jgi:hypothetical protein
MSGVKPSKRAQTNPKSILHRPQGSQKKNMTPGARSPGQGMRFGRTSPPASTIFVVVVESSFALGDVAPILDLVSIV